MELQKIFQSDEERAVSPVIGVILMVAITVILAAVIATFVLGLGDTQNSAPQVSFDYEVADSSATPTEYTVIHAGGDSFDGSNVIIQNDSSSNSWSSSGGSSDATAGDTAGAEAGARIVYQDPESDSSSVIGEVPE